MVGSLRQCAYPDPDGRPETLDARLMSVASMLELVMLEGTVTAGGVVMIEVMVRVR
jgi:hypothetical protein